MFIIDDLLASPARGLMFVLRQINDAVQQEREAQGKATMTELAALHRELDEERITEDEFDAREHVLLSRLDRMKKDDGDESDNGGS
jgi:Gas vesicle protein G